LTLSYSPYPAYKPSGIPWLGDIPVHWGVRKLKQLVECLDGRRIPLNSDQRGRIQGEYPYWGANCIVDYINDWLYDEELVLLGEDGAPFFDKSKSVAFFVTGKIWVNNHAHVLRPKTVKGEYLAYALNVVDYKEYIDGSTRDKLTQLSMGTISLPIPPLPEQQAIAAYLDGETTRLDALAARYRRLLALLDEKRRTLITHAVTRGLNPTVPLKPSGIPWLGDIPAHWIFDRAKFIFRKMSRPTREEDDVVTAFRDGTVTLRSNRRTEGFTFSIKEIGYQGVRKGDLVIHQMDGFAGAIGVSDSDGKCTPIYSICTPIIPAITHYYGYLLRHMAKSDFILSLAKGIRERSSDFRFDVFRELVLPIPPLPEQQAIAAYLDQETTRLDGLKTKIETLLARLAEYRAALISAAVTGKMDVRDAAFETIQ